MDISTITKIHVEPGDLLIVELEKVESFDWEALQALKTRLPRNVAILASTKPINIHRLTQDQVKIIAEIYQQKKNHEI